MEFLNPAVIGSLAGGLIALVVTIVIINLRRVVSTNEVHIVQSAKRTSSYGKESGNGNAYYEWPSWMPYVGVTKSVLPLSVFDLDLNDYNAYDKDRLPFKVHIKAFFRIADSNKAAERVNNFAELRDQLLGVVQGAVRAILASHDIEEIMQGRSKFAEVFTKEVHDQVANWGIDTVKNLELMDIRDTDNSQVIANIMAKKKSHIDMESRTEVAKNKKIAEIAEIEAKREVDLQGQQAKQAVGLRTIETERELALQKEAQVQVVQEQAKLTKEKEMAVRQVSELRGAEIEKSVQVVRAQQDKETQIVRAEAERNTSVLKAQGQKETMVLTSEGQLESKRREAEGITLEGQARAESEKAMQLAPVQAQITLAKEIGSNESYQKYLVTIRQVEANRDIGIEQAKAMAAADIKVIANTGNVTEGLDSVSGLLSSKGGTALAGMLEGLSQTDLGQQVLGKVLKTTPPSKNGSTNGSTKA